MDITKKFGVALRSKRHELGMIQEELARSSGLHRTYISDLERGARNPSLESMDKLAKALKVPITALLGE